MRFNPASRGSLGFHRAGLGTITKANPSCSELAAKGKASTRPTPSRVRGRSCRARGRAGAGRGVGRVAQDLFPVRGQPSAPSLVSAVLLCLTAATRQVKELSCRQVLSQLPRLAHSDFSKTVSQWRRGVTGPVQVLTEVERRGGVPGVARIDESAEMERRNGNHTNLATAWRRQGCNVTASADSGCAA